MSYSLEFSFVFRNQPTLTLNGQLYDALGATVGSLITTGFVNLGNGTYSYLATLPDGHVGTLVIYDSALATRCIAFSINPAEMENANVKSSTLATQTSVDTITGYVDTEVAAIKAKTDNLPSDPASTSGLASAHGSGSWATATGFATPTNITAGTITAVTGAVGSVAGNVGGNVIGSIGSLATQAKADVNAEADTALADVGVTTTVTGRIDTNINSRASQSSVDALNDLGAADIDARLTAYDGATQADLNAVQTTITTAIAALNNLSAAQVWSYGTRTLTSFGTLIADIWSNVTRTLTSGGDGVTVDEIRAIVTEVLSSRVTISDDMITDTTTTGVWNFVINQGETFVRTLTVTRSVGLFDSDSYTAAMQFRRSIGDTTAFLTLTSEAGLTLTVADGGASITFAMLISAEDTAALNPGHAVYDLELTAADETVVRLLAGKVVISREVTRP